MATQAIAAIESLAKATETATLITKATSGFLEVIGKTLSTLVNTILLPLAGPFQFILTALFLAFGKLYEVMKEFIKDPVGWLRKNVFDPLMKEIDKILEPLRRLWDWIKVHIIDPILKFLNDLWMWIDNNIITPLRKFFGDVLKWIDENLVQPFLKFFDDAKKWIDENITQPFWNAISNITKWVDENIVQPFSKAFENIKKWITDNIVNPFKTAVERVKTWVDEHIRKPFEDTLRKVTGFIDTYIYQPFVSLMDKLKKLINNTLAVVFNYMLAIPGVGDILRLAGLRPMKLQSFQEGGTVPGKGPQIAIVHGGEKIIPEGKSAATITLNFYGYQDDKFIQKVKDVIRSQGTVYNL